MSDPLNHPSTYSGRIERFNLPENHFFRVPENRIGLIITPERRKTSENIPYIRFQDSENQEPYQNNGGD